MRECSVLIADDEPVIREGLTELIKQSGLPLSARAVPNGQKALEWMEEEHFDLIITDIEMPDMDGLALIRRCREEGFSSRFVVLSGFDRFDYVRNAYRFGIEDYLLKPVNRKELYTLLEKIMKELDRERPLQTLWTRFFRAPDDEAVREELDRIYREIRGWHYVLLQGKGPLLRRQLPSEYLLVDEENPRDLGLLIHDDGGRGPSLNEQLMELYMLLRTKDLQVTLFTGARVLRYWDLPQSRRQALELRPLLFYRGRNGIITYGEHPSLNGQEHPKGLDRIFSGLARAGDFCLAGKAFEEELDRFHQELMDFHLKPSICRMKMQQFLYELISSLENGGIAADRLAAEYSPLFTVDSDHTLAELILMLKDFLGQVARERAERGGRGHSVLVEEILCSIKENYVLDLNLQDLSEKYRMNKAYLGQLFKKHTGVSFLSYLNDTRLQEACRLLESTDLKVYQIAYQVGYRDPSYFMNRFEKKWGITPLAYRKKKALD